MDDNKCCFNTKPEYPPPHVMFLGFTWRVFEQKPKQAAVGVVIHVMAIYTMSCHLCLLL
jgi:hypothetical protein